MAQIIENQSKTYSIVIIRTLKLTYILRLFAVLSVAQGELDVSAPRLRRRQEDPRHEVDSSGQRESV